MNASIVMPDLKADNVVGLTVGFALETLAKAGVLPADIAFDIEHGAASQFGEIVRQEPAPGQSLPPGQTVRLTVNPRAVPAVTPDEILREIRRDLAFARTWNDAVARLEALLSACVEAESSVSRQAWRSAFASEIPDVSTEDPPPLLREGRFEELVARLKQGKPTEVAALRRALGYPEIIGLIARFASTSRLRAAFAGRQMRFAFFDADPAREAESLLASPIQQQERDVCKSYIVYLFGRMEARGRLGHTALAHRYVRERLCGGTLGVSPDQIERLFPGRLFERLIDDVQRRCFEPFRPYAYIDLLRGYFPHVDPSALHCRASGRLLEVIFPGELPALDRIRAEVLHHLFVPLAWPISHAYHGGDRIFVPGEEGQCELGAVVLA